MWKKQRNKTASDKLQKQRVSQYQLIDRDNNQVVENNRQVLIGEGFFLGTF